jgi:type I restriction enzyme R subunit
LVSEQETRVEIDALLGAAGWLVRDVSTADIHAARGVAIREFPLLPSQTSDILISAFRRSI